TWIEKALTTGGRPAGSARFSSRTAVDMRLLVGGIRPAGGDDIRANRPEAVTLQADRIARRRKTMQRNLSARHAAARPALRLAAAARRLRPAAPTSPALRPP